MDSHGRSSFGRFLSVKPDVGLITSTARTFIQDGVTTEYATQVLGTTLDNGRLYAQLLTKSSRVLYNDQPSKSYDTSKKKWNLNDNVINVNQFIKNTDYISPSRGDVAYVFPTKLPYTVTENTNSNPVQEISEEEILNESPSNNFRVPFDEHIKNRIVPQVENNNVKVFKISPQVRDITHENVIHKEDFENKKILKSFAPSKVRPWDNLPTFTVRNEFSPSGLSFLGDFPDLDEQTERSKLTTPAERRAKFLFKAGLAKPNPKDFKSITYSGFADFTTTVGDTVIIFTPHTTEMHPGASREIIVPSQIQPTTTLLEPPLATKIETFLSQEPPMETKTIEGHKLEMKTMLPTMVIDKTDRLRDGKIHTIEEHINMDAMSAVLAHEQGKEETLKIPSVTLSPDAIQPSETQPKLLSTPSHEDIAKIFASLQALAKQSTQPLSSQPVLEETKDSNISGATTIFFDDDHNFETGIPSIEPSKSYTPTTPMSSTESVTTEQLPETTEKPTTIEQPETTTSDILTTNEEQSTIPMSETTPKIENIEEVENVVCTTGSQVVPTTVYKTLTYLTTFFIPSDETTTTSIKSNEVVSTETGFETRPCDNTISPSTVITSPEPTIIPKTTSEAPIAIPKETIPPETTTQSITEIPVTTEQDTTPAETTIQITTTEHQTEQETEPMEVTTEDGEEVELIFKTLYTTYTYLTTYFQESTTSIASRIVVTTNVITSTLDPSSESTDDAVAGLFEREDSLVSSYKSKTISFDDIADITPSSVNHIEPTATTSLQGYLDASNPEDSDLTKPTPVLDDNAIAQNGVKTYYTTYTYFTTIFVDGETEISSRTEVYTNYVTPSLPSIGNDLQATTIPTIDESKPEILDQEEIKSKIYQLNIDSDGKYNTINRQKPNNEIDDSTKIDIAISSTKEPAYVTLQRDPSTTEDNEISDNAILDLSEYETISTMVTDVRSSTSKGDKRIIDNVDKRNILLDDQIVSESNNDSEILPSPTLLLQTSYTTFTYFTTMYHGTTSSNVVSRLETVTNVVTQTLTPTQMLNSEDQSLPITYFTTFTYWTTLYKDGTTRVTSREETVSNIETPTIIPTSLTASIDPTSTTSIVTTSLPELTPEAPPTTVIPSVVGDDELTTYFTTYTYYTTSYVGDSTILNSRLETITNVLNNSVDIATNQIGRAVGAGNANKIEDVKSEKPEPTSTLPTQPTGLLSSVINTVENNGTTTLLSTDIYGTYIDGLYAKVLESTSKIITDTIAPSSVTVENLKPTGVVSINQGKIVDAEGVSTLFYTTQAIGTYIDNLYAQVIQSTSSLTVDAEKKAALPTDIPIAQKTGLVRLIEGSIKENDTTTFYQSKVLGTFIDGRYAQIIESTSSFLVGTAASVDPTSVVTNITPTPTQAPDQSVTSTDVISPTPAVIEGSISDSAKTEEENSTEENEEGDDDGRVKSRLTFQSRKRTFTPVIRPFASRQRPTFAPKKKQAGQSAAATITRSEITPTVTAVPASKPNRFGGRRSSSGASQIQPTASGKRFSRPKSTPGGLSSSFGRRGNSKIQPTSSGYGASSRRGGFRSSSLGAIRPSASLFGARPRIRPTLSAGLNRSPSSTILTQTALDEENDLTTLVTDEPNGDPENPETTLALQTTTEPAKRGNNPLLRFRRPPLNRPPVSRSNANKPVKKVTTTTTTTPRPRVTPGRPNSLLNRPRPNALFPRRGLFTTTTNAPEEEEVEEDLDEEDLEAEKDNEDTDYDSSLKNTQTAKPPTTPEPASEKKSGKNVQIKPFFRKRSKRDIYSRFRRPTSRTTEAPETSSEAPTKARFAPKRGGKTTQATTSAPTARKRITPSKSQNRTPFTLREKDKRVGYKRPNNVGTSRPTARTTTRGRTTRLRNGYQAESSTNGGKSSSNRRGSTTTRGRTTPRQRQQELDQDNYVIPKFDGTITVTHQIPTEVTIPVVNGKITEYKNVVTAQYSTEILDPREYSTSVNPFGKEVKVLLSENTNIGNNGATLVTQFVLNEKPTTTVIFTPTFINRRKTSFSHVVPSTVYDVESVVNTIQPALAAQAPLANILLSQLLLGGLQPQPNPLLGLQGIQQPGIIPPTPTTEFKTRTTTYVTTVTSTISTVIPLTFRGKEILTTILDSSINVVTATEFLTDTVVVTPAFGYPAAPQLNTALLLPLLQQQLQQGGALNPTPPPQQPANVFNLKGQPAAERLYQREEDLDLAIDNSEELQETEPIKQAPRRKSPRKPKKTKVEPPKETSVITLYVSGRTPGEFTTVLSTVTIGEENSGRRKRETEPFPVTSSRLPLDFDDKKTFDSLIMPTTREVQLEASEHGKETESLESFIGDVSKHFTTQTLKPTKSSRKYKLKYVKASESNKQSSDNFLA